MVEIIERRQSPLELLPALRHHLGWALASVLRGRPQIIGELLATGGRCAAAYRELRSRRKLLAEAEKTCRTQTASSGSPLATAT